MRCERLAGGDDVVGEPAQTGEAVRADAVGLEHVEAVAVEQLAELVGLTCELATGDPDVDSAPQLRMPDVVAAVQRLFHPVHLLRGELVGDVGGALDVPCRRRVPRHPPTLVAVDHQLERVADRVADRA